jgi:hypothetical protein
MYSYIKKLLLLLICLVTFTNCSEKTLLPKTYYDNSNKVGVLYIIDSIKTTTTGDQSFLESIITGNKRFKEPLNLINEKIKPNLEIKNLYSNIYNEKGKSLTEINYTLDVKRLNEFVKPAKSEKKYYRYDLRFLKSKKIDELLIVKVEYGLLVSYDGLIEDELFGNCKIESKIIDLNDNSIIFNDFSFFIEKIKGSWGENSPEYTNLKNTILSAIQKTIELEKVKFSK